jgi:hypothetical protein
MGVPIPSQLEDLCWPAGFRGVVRRDLRDLRPRDMIDINLSCGCRARASIPAENRSVRCAQKANCFRSALFLMLAADAFKGVQDQVGNFGLNTLVQV